MSATSSSFAPLPTGCEGHLSSTHAGAGYVGCITGNATVLQTCCSKVGSAPVFSDDTCGCPFTSTFTVDDSRSFLDCTISGLCFGPGPPNRNYAATSASPRWNTVAIMIFFGVSLLFSEMGA
ncbi:hypothetical protein MVEN_02173900 [Mycena venus]|uniref:Uncharacterized protein n=1 Tax=Mycena venus TaxID=2733690 RepID=A0A8H6X803_9AGAR|nr:hypothetical protein MVEN_02173900 [Mycena venus]